jgi:hypothetical protein
MRLARQLGARRFEANVLEMKARMIFDLGHRKEAADIFQEALAICREDGALARVVEDAADRAALLAEGEEMLKRGAISHNHFWFYRDAIEAMLSARDGPGALIYVDALERYTQAEPLPWSELFAARGRLLVQALDGVDDEVQRGLTSIRVSLEGAGLRTFLPAVEAALR